ncbi:hypothetical protein MRX96_046367 [Rhipicephalus microplus]
MQNPFEQEATCTVERAEPATAAAQAHTRALRQTTGTNEGRRRSLVGHGICFGRDLAQGLIRALESRPAHVSLEDKISSFCADSANRITVSARNCIMSRVFEMGSLVLGHAGKRSHEAEARH